MDENDHRPKIAEIGPGRVGQPCPAWGIEAPPAFS